MKARAFNESDQHHKYNGRKDHLLENDDHFYRHAKKKMFMASVFDITLLINTL